MMADWSQLSAELIVIISSNVDTVGDYIRFRAVCKSWRLDSPPVPRRLPRQFPWLMLPSDVANPVRRFFSIPDGKTHLLHLPEACFGLCCGSSHGWLVFEHGTAVSLLNPITRARIQLPPITAAATHLIFVTFQQGLRVGVPRPSQSQISSGYTRHSFEKRYISKAILSSDPSIDPSATTVLAILATPNKPDTPKLAFCRVGDDSWTLIQSSAMDVTFYCGRFYSITNHGMIIGYDLCSPVPTAVFVPPLPVYGEKRFLVEESCNGLRILVWNFTDSNSAKEYSVFKLFNDGRQQWWCEVRDIGGGMLFLDGDNCLPLSASSPYAWKRNCICFASFHYLQSYEDGDLGSHALRVFSLEEGSLISLPYNVGVSSMDWPPPVWFSPSLSYQDVDSK